MQETKPGHTSRWRECSRKFAHMVRDYIATTWRTLSPESRKKIKQAIAAFVISVVLALVVAGEGFSYAQYCTLFLLFFAIQLWITEAAPPFAVGVFIVGFLVYALGNADGIDVGQYVKTWSDGIIILFLGGFFLAEGMQKTRLDYKLLQKLLPRFGQQARYILLGLMLTTACISMLMSNTATTAMMIATAAPLYTNSKGSFSRALLLGIPAAASIGGMGTIIGSPPNAIAATALGLDFAGWMKFGLPMMLALLPLMLFSLFIVLKPNLSAKVQVEHEDIPWTLHRVIALLIFLAAAVAWVLGKQIEERFGIKNPDTFVALTAAVAVVVFGVVRWREVARNTDWGVLLLFGGGITLSTLLQKSGASAALGQEMASTFVLAHPFIVILAVSTFIIFLTEFTSNTASAALLVPVFASVAEQMGMPKEVLVMVIGIGASCAFMLPVATPPNAIVFGTGIVTQRDMLKVGMVLNLLSIALVAAWAYFFLM